MSDFLLAVAEGDFRFDWEEVVPKILEQWSGTQFFPAHGRVATVSHGQLEFPPQAERFGLIVRLLSDRDGMGIDGPLHDAVAFVAWLTHQHWYPTAGSLMLPVTHTEPHALRPQMEAGWIIQAHPE